MIRGLRPAGTFRRTSPNEANLVLLILGITNKDKVFRSLGSILLLYFSPDVSGLIGLSGSRHENLVGS